jgi:nitroreductase
MSDIKVGKYLGGEFQMELLKGMKARRAIRKFKPDPVPDEYVRELLEAARLAPSGSNLQPARYIVIKSQEARAKLGECTPLPFVAEAPVVIVCCADSKAFASAGERYKELQESGAFAETPMEKPNPREYLRRNRSMGEAEIKAYLSLNVAIAIDHITLRAVDLGLGTCWVMMFDQDKLRQAFEIDERYHLLALLPVGYPAQDPAQRPRLAVEELLLKEV